MQHRRGPKFWVPISLVITVLAVGLFSPTANAKTRVEANVFLPGSAYSLSSLTALENTLGVTFTAAMWYQDWSAAFDPTPANNFHATGHIPELTWEPQISGTGISYDAVNAGSYDSYLTSFGQAVAALGYPIRLSLAPEMNTDWTPWGIGSQGNNATNFKSFYQHVVQKFRDAGASNVSWVWSPNVTPSNAASLYGSYSNIYPGDAYVDYMGLDGYNWGTTQSWSVWQSFAQVFQSSYQQLLGVSGKNILIMEIASAEAGGNKAAWITDMFTQLQSGYSRIQGFTWFDINKETDWRINSSPASQTAFVNGYNGVAASSAGSTSSSTATSPTTSSTVKKPAVSGNSTSPTVSSSTPTVNPSTATPAADSASQKYPVDGTLSPKLAGSIVASAALAKQLSLPERGMLIATLLAGLLAIAFLTVRRYQTLHLSPLYPLQAAVVRVERWFGIGHVDSVIHRSHWPTSRRYRRKF